MKTVAILLLVFCLAPTKCFADLPPDIAAEIKAAYGDKAVSEAGVSTGSLLTKAYQANCPLT
jgi:hypothetical protein